MNIKQGTEMVPELKGMYLNGKNAVVTGGTSGIGLAIAKAFLNNGCSEILITSRNEERLYGAVKQLETLYPEKTGKIHGTVLNLEITSSFNAAFDEMVKKLTGDINVWVNNAGIYKGTRFCEVKETDWDALLDINLKAQYFLSQLVSKYMIEREIRGNILNLCSSSSFRPSIDPYMISKLGMSGLTLGMAKKLIPHGIVVNGIAPGPTATPMLRKKPDDDLSHGGVPAGRYILPEEVANLAVFLVCGMGRMIVGDVVKITGGSAVTTYDDVMY